MTDNKIPEPELRRFTLFQDAAIGPGSNWLRQGTEIILAADFDAHVAGASGLIDHMVNRFLAWRLPENFTPDGGISFTREFNEHTPYPMTHEPTGTNLLDFQQAKAMITYLLEGFPAACTPPSGTCPPFSQCEEIAADPYRCTLPKGHLGEHEANLLKVSGTRPWTRLNHAIDGLRTLQESEE